MAWWQPDVRWLFDGPPSRKRRLPVLGSPLSFHERCCFGCNDGVAVDPVGDQNDGGGGGRRATSPSSPGSHCAGAWSPLTTVAPSGYASALLDAGMPEEDCASSCSSTWRYAGLASEDVFLVGGFFFLFFPSRIFTQFFLPFILKLPLILNDL